MGAGGRALADQNVEFVVFQRGIKNFLQRRLQAMDFVDEEYLLIAQVGQNCGEIPFNLQGRAGSLLKGRAQFIGDDGRQRSLAKPGRSVK